MAWNFYQRHHKHVKELLLLCHEYFKNKTRSNLGWGRFSIFSLKTDRLARSFVYIQTSFSIMCSNLGLNVGHGPDPLQELDDPGLLLRHVAGSDAIDLAGGLEQLKEKSFFFLIFVALPVFHSKWVPPIVFTKLLTMILKGGALTQQSNPKKTSPLCQQDTHPKY
jgi:hypothetical protein